MCWSHIRQINLCLHILDLVCKKADLDGYHFAKSVWFEIYDHINYIYYSSCIIQVSASHSKLYHLLVCNFFPVSFYLHLILPMFCFFIWAWQLKKELTMWTEMELYLRHRFSSIYESVAFLKSICFVYCFQTAWFTGNFIFVSTR